MSQIAIDNDYIVEQFREVLDSLYTVRPDDYNLSKHVHLKCKLAEMDTQTLMQIYMMPSYKWAAEIYRWLDQRYSLEFSHVDFPQSTRSLFRPAHWRRVR
jgi:hypothetical protein